MGSSNNLGYILLVEDEENLQEALKLNLELEGYEVTGAGDGAEALKKINQEYFDLIILDVMLPEIDGIDVTENIRLQNNDVPILMVSAKSSTADKVLGLKKGADDYITKPFSIEELQLKIEIFLKRSKVYKSEKTESIFNIGLYNFDFNNLSLVSPQKSRTLTQKEADVLRYFIINKNTVIKRSAILENIWGEDDYFLGRSLDVFISRLRKYLSEDTSITLENIHGVGFRLKV